MTPHRGMVFQTLIRVGAVCFMAYVSLPFSAVQSAYWPAMQAVLIALFLLLVFDRGKPAPLVQASDWPLWFLIVSLMAGLVSPTNRSMAFHRYAELAVILFCGYYVGKGLLHTARDRLFVITTLCLLSSAVALYGLGYCVSHSHSSLFTKHVLQYPAFYEEYVRTFHPTVLSNYVCLSSFFGWLLLRHGSTTIKAVGLLTLILMSPYLLLPFWRGTLFVFLVMGCCYFFLKRNYAAVITLLLVSMSAALLLSWVPQTSQKLDLESSLFYPTGIFSRYRVSRMKAGWLMFKDRPLCGVGFDHYRLLFDAYYPVKAKLPTISTDSKIADNMYWTLLAETGLVGFLGFWLFVLLLLARGLRAAHSPEQTERQHGLLVTMAVFAGALVSMFGYELLYWRTPCMLVSFVCGSLSVLAVPEQDGRERALA